MTLPAIFLSHGSPMILIEPSPARDFLATLGARFEDVKAIVVVSAHHDTREAVVTASPQPETIHDFGRGFPQALFDARYPALGDPALAKRIEALVRDAGLPATLDPSRGLDHGAWVPLMLGWPEADVPVVQLSVSSQHPPAWHYAIGRALVPLREEGVLIVGSGSLTHNLRAIFVEGRDHDAAVPDWVSQFADWVHARAAAGDEAALLDAIDQAPHGRDNHPTPDHLLPFFAAMGAGGVPLNAKRLHHSYTYGVLAMDAYAFH
ncbi:class III extradiol ring-cleavage dioxygenase [uncultured Sphingomonas sp.]|uniref:DODA-type extradiol aromatic ring-opening family dioxygenase n=1 Tax=uncultured Sphingomonas sp. TaxID=158754 RepID=UPI0025ECE719|nr:class III extradiol ring-cleavage dioxygenase [uncultured Sphingomonas sp.]